MMSLNVEGVCGKTIGKIEEIVFESRENNLNYEKVFDIDPHELYQKKDLVYLIDVRQSEEFHGDLGHIPNAKLIALDELEKRLAELPKNKTVVFVCRSGGRSARAAHLAIEHGFENVFNLKGGMILWNELHYNTEA